MKKTLAMLLALAMVLALVPAFADEVENPYAEYGVEIYTDAEGNVIDLGGMVIVVADWWSSDWHNSTPNTFEEEERFYYRTWLEETYNFKIYSDAVSTWASSPEDFVNFATSGGEENYVWLLRSNAILGPMQSGLFYDLSTLDAFDFEEEKWNGIVRDLLTKDGAIYGMRAEAAEPRKGIFFNKRLLQEAGVDPESLYDMQADGTWTWEAFEELCEKLHRDVDNDGVIDKYAIKSFSSHFFPAALVSNGIGFVMVDEEGKYYNAAETDAFLEAANWAMDMFVKYDMPSPEGANWDYFEPAFVNGEVAMTCHEDYAAGQTFANMADDFGFVMFPKGPRAETYMFSPTDNVLVIPACYDAERAAKIAFAYNLYTDPTPGFEDSEDWKAGYYAKYRDLRAVDETLELMRQPEHQFVWYTDMIAGYDLGPDWIWEVSAGNVTPAERGEAMRGTWNAYIDAANAQ